MRAIFIGAVFALGLVGCADDHTQHADEATMRRITPAAALQHLATVSATYNQLYALSDISNPGAGMCRYYREGIAGGNGQLIPFGSWVYTAKRSGLPGEEQTARVFLQSGTYNSNSSALLGFAVVSTFSNSAVPSGACFAYVRQSPLTQSVEQELTDVISALRIIGVRRL